MDFKLKILGTASAMPVSGRYSSAHVLDVRGRLFLIDCGEGCQVQLRKMHVSFLKIDCICISHIHGDHVFGLFGLLSSMSLMGRTAPLHIYSGQSFALVLEYFNKCFGQGLSYEIVHHEIACSAPELIMETKSVELYAFPLRHRMETYGFLFREKEPGLNVRKDIIAEYGLSLSEIASLKRGVDVVRHSETDGKKEVIAVDKATYKPYIPRSYAYCSDTVGFPELSSWVKGLDLLYHEATYPASMADVAARTFHSTTLDAANCALEASAGRLVIGHYSSRFTDVSHFGEEARSVFADTILAKEGDIIEIPLKKTQF